MKTSQLKFLRATTLRLHKLHHFGESMVLILNLDVLIFFGYLLFFFYFVRKKKNSTDVNKLSYVGYKYNFYFSCLLIFLQYY